MELAGCLCHMKKPAESTGSRLMKASIRSSGHLRWLEMVPATSCRCQRIRPAVSYIYKQSEHRPDLRLAWNFQVDPGPRINRQRRVVSKQVGSDSTATCFEPEGWSCICHMQRQWNRLAVGLKARRWQVERPDSTPLFGWSVGPATCRCR